jgi:hypothetical protein
MGPLVSSSAPSQLGGDHRSDGVEPQGHRALVLVKEHPELDLFKVSSNRP